MSIMSKFSRLSFLLLALYMDELDVNPIRSKSLTSCILALLGSYVSQKLAGTTPFNYDAMFGFGIFGLIFGGSIPHLFYVTFSEYLSQNTNHPLIYLFLIERLIFMPIFSFFTLFALTCLEGKSVEESLNESWQLWPPFLKLNVVYLTLPQFLNIFYVPPILRVLTTNIMGFIWACLISYKTSQRNQSRGHHRDDYRTYQREYE